MRLKKITIFGFKSFADKISLEFDCAILGIVGPNGCGKSNIVDAFRWVMGEVQAKAFRASAMQDVLFAGNEKRKPANFAEVTIVLTDIQEALNLPYDEIAITRRLFRNNDSEYLINKEPVRLKDIQDLLLGSGLGKNAFSIFEQGKLDSVIHLHPLQRRAIFDEAAGIGRFLQRKKETLKRLDLATENYQRIKDIHVEVEKKAKTLKKQAVQAKSFQESKETLKELEKNVLITKWKKIAEKKEKNFQKITVLKNEMTQKKAALDELEKLLEGLRKQQSENESQTKILQKQLFELKTLETMQSGKLKEKKELLVQGEKKEKALIREKEDLIQKREQELAKKAEKEKALTSVLETCVSQEREVLKSREIKEKIERETLHLREDLRKLSTSYLKAINEEKKIHGELQKKLLELKWKKERVEKIAQALQEKKKKASVLKDESAAKKKEVSNLASEIDGMKNDIEKLERSIKKENSSIEESKEEKRKLISKIEKISAQEETLLRLKEQFEGFSVGAKRLLQESNNPKSALYKKIQPLFELLASQKEWDALFSKSLFLYADTLVVEDQKTLNAVLNFALKEKLSNFSIFSLGVLKKKIPLLDHFLESIEVIESIDAKQPPLGKEYISKEGDFYLTRHGVIFSIGAKSDIFLREMEIQSLGSEKEKLKKEVLLFEEKLESALEEQRNKESSLKTLSLQHRKKEMSLVQENFMLQRILADFSKENKEMQELEKEKEELLEKKEEENATQMEFVLAEKIQEVSTLFKVQQEKEKFLKTHEESLKEAGLIFDKMQKEWQKIISDKQKIENEIFLLNVKEKQLQEDSRKKEKELESVKKQMMEADESISEIRHLSNARELEMQELESLCQKWESSFKEVKQQIEKTGKSLQSVRIEENGLEKELYKVELLEGEETNKQKSLNEELKIHHQLNSEDIPSLTGIVDEDLKEAERRIQELRHQVDKIEGINLAAIEEYKEEEERHQFLTKQLNDLESAKKDLEGIIEKLDSESRKVFKKTYDKIRTNFQKNFTLLFNGGEADLKFTESPDVLEAGIEIIAKPPGKQMRSITLLSGGEKCLTALALLFSIFEVKPAPFCILDEVDAPLDDSNVDRFSKMIQQYTDETQFILVTHNKKTMAYADLLIGISMEEKGVSKLISLAFEKRYAMS